MKYKIKTEEYNIELVLQVGRCIKIKIIYLQITRTKQVVKVLTIRQNKKANLLIQ